MSYARFQTVPVGNLRVHVCATDKFKTNTLSAMIQQELSPQIVTKTALLPLVLQRGTETYPTTLQLKQRLEELYGANLFADVYKRGERHVLQVGLEIANEQYLRAPASLLEEGVAFLSEVLTRPVTENGGFKESYVAAEKKNLKQKIESLKDDKIRYAAQRCIEEMCAGEPYSLFNYGRSEDLDHIDAQSLYTYYRDLIRLRPIDLFFVGNVSVDEVVRLVERHFPTDQAERVPVETGEVRHTVNEVKEVVDRLDVKQGKLNLGCRTQVSIRDDDYVALMMYNGILGGFPHSKLFVNVREKASLAYYASSRLESHKGIMTIQSGIEIANYQRAVDIIREQLDAMRQGDINEVELEQTKATLINQLRERQDRSYDLIDAEYHSILSGRPRPLEQLVEELKQVTKADVQRVAEKVQLDTIYFLRDKGEGTADAAN
ncbi:insulinase family protein [Polycladomyces sp. WAk]|uniref:Insulinase family protein n=1 Tax=Polycladomyces zharkentensis TaxID=2807616 RepID=A0ABS2WIU1_9BACL|nr:insulinase family protein [Polycladomyces sp. WAk]